MGVNHVQTLRVDCWVDHTIIVKSCFGNPIWVAGPIYIYSYIKLYLNMYILYIYTNIPLVYNYITIIYILTTISIITIIIIYTYH